MIFHFLHASLLLKKPSVAMFTLEADIASMAFNRLLCPGNRLTLTEVFGFCKMVCKERRITKQRLFMDGN